MADSSVVLKATDLVKSYKVPGGIVRAVRGISLELHRGKTLAIVGESGCGKSTLARLLVGLERPDSGTLHKASLISMVFQDSLGALHPRRRVFELIVEPLLIRDRRLRPTAAHVAVAEELAAKVGLSRENLRAFPHELSGGQRQRVNIARALSLDPSVILLDEPVSALDVSIQAQILNLLMDLQNERGVSILFISHDLSVVRHIAHDVAVLYLGSVLEMGPVDKVLSRPSHPYTQALLQSDPARALAETAFLSRPTLKGEPPSPLMSLPGCSFSSRCPYVEDKCREIRPVLKNREGVSAACLPLERGLDLGYERSTQVSQ